MRIVFLILMSVVLSVSFQTPAQAGLLEFLFPTLKTEEVDPAETLTAPFAMEPSAEGEEAAGSAADQHTVRDLLAGQGADGKPLMPENAIPLNQPHRSTSAIVQWVMTATSEAFMFDKPDFNENLAATKPLFGPSGRTQYIQSLSDLGITDTLKSNKYDIRSFADGQPVLLNEGVVDGRYRWLYDVELMVTYLNRGTSGYANAQPINKKVSVRAQIGRSKDAQNRDEIWIETWEANLMGE